MFPVKLNHCLKDCGLLGAIRKYDVHAGVDFYCEVGAEVACLRKGVVIDVFQFTGTDAGSPWWNATQAVVVESEGLVFVYGEVNATVNVGDKLATNAVVGKVSAVLKKNKGVTPTAMLHLEVWEKNHYQKNYVWQLNTPKPAGLLNPVDFLNGWVIKTEFGYILEDSCGNIIQWFDMAANCKAHCVGAGISPVYLSTKSSLPDRQTYTTLTNKTLWFDK